MAFGFNMVQCPPLLSSHITICSHYPLTFPLPLPIPLPSLLTDSPAPGTSSIVLPLSSLGLSHVALVTSVGSVITFGCNSHHQLGLGPNDLEPIHQSSSTASSITSTSPLSSYYKPAVVRSLLLEIVTSVACGDSHTLVRHMNISTLLPS